MSLMNSSALNAALDSSIGFMGRSFLSGMLLRDFHSHTRLDRPAHFPRTTGHALPCSAQTDFLGAGAHALHRLRNLVRPAMGRAQGQIGGRGLRGFSCLIGVFHA